MTGQTKVDTLLAIIQQVANERPTFFHVKGEGAGDRDTNDFMREVRRRALAVFGQDCSEKRICGSNNSAVDFYFEDEATIVEIALGLRLPMSEYEKDIFKALMAQETVPVTRLVMIGKAGASLTCARPGRLAVREWAKRHHGLTVDVYDIENIHLQPSLPAPDME